MKFLALWFLVLTVGGQPFEGVVRAEGSRTLVDARALAEALDLRVHPIYGGLCVARGLEETCAARPLASPGRVLVEGNPVHARFEPDGRVLVDLEETSAALGLVLAGDGEAWRLPGPASTLAPDRRIVRPNATRAGGDLDLRESLVPGRWNVVYYFVDWCPSCWQTGPVLEGLAARDARIALVEVDLGDWGSPVARAHAVKASPTIRVYDGAGALVADEDAASEWLQRKLGLRLPTRLKCVGAPGGAPGAP